MLDVSGCLFLNSIYLGGTKLHGVNLPNGGVLKTVQYPSTIKNITIINQPYLTNLIIGDTLPADEIPSNESAFVSPFTGNNDYSNVTGLYLDNVKQINSLEIVQAMANELNNGQSHYLYLADIEWVMTTAEFLSLAEKKYNNQLKSLEKNLIKRLYKIPKKIKKEEDELLPTLENKKDINIENENENKNNILLNYVESTPNFNTTKNKNKKKLALSLNENLDTLFKQTQQINKYEMKNYSRRSNNESDYNIYKNGRIGCRIKTLNSMTDLANSYKKNNAMKRFNTEGNTNFSRRMQHMKIKKNKEFLPNSSLEKVNA